ncbi:MAG: DUF3465 domain-containing protein [Gammaproteobacteria bacterium]|nr:DUF3465 domain-containing protein [Gammaproteobacteria bacterium]
MTQKKITTLVAIVILIVWGLVFGFPESDDTTQADNTKQTINNNSNISATESTSAYDDKQLIQSFKQKRSKVWMQISMEVTRLLADDNEGSRHQKFIAKTSSGHTVLVSHNIDLADRVPVSRGDEITLRGRYEWTDRGGVLHWTHHDPRGRIEGGWIKLDGQFYR